MARMTAAWLLPRWSVVIILMAISMSPCCSAVRPGGDSGVKLTPEGSVIREGGSTLEEYELRQSDPIMAHFVSLGSAAHKLLNKSGYAYGSLVGIAHSDMDKEYGEGPERKAWFPMVVVLDVVEGGSDEGVDDVTVQYELVLNFDSKKYSYPGLVIIEAWKKPAAGGTSVSLDVQPPELKGFLEQNRPGIAMMFGVIIASGIVKFLRRGIEKLLRKAKQDKEEAAEISGEGGDSKTNTAAGAMATPKAKGPVDAKKEN